MRGMKTLALTYAALALAVAPHAFADEPAPAVDRILAESRSLDDPLLRALVPPAK